MNKEQYEKFCEGAENMRCYDGRGTYDLYVCETGAHNVVTTYKDKGVTPFTIVCPECGRTMTHKETYKSVHPSVQVIGWVRPTYEQYCKLSPAVKEHVENGGLILETYLK